MERNNVVANTAEASISSQIDVENSKTSSSKELSFHEEALALNLLQSVDSRIAAAAKRIFFNSSNTTSTENEISNTDSTQACTTKSEERKDAAFQNGRDGIHFDNSSNFSDVNSIVFSPRSNNETTCVIGSEVTSLSKPIQEQKTSPLSSASSLYPNELRGAFAQGTTDKASSNQAANERLQRSRERNRIHARRTRQRKKEHMQSLQNRVDKLRNEQLILKQTINDKNTANILLVMGGNTLEGESVPQSSSVDPEIDALLKRTADEMPAASKVSSLPALHLPRQGRKRKASCGDSSLQEDSSIAEDGSARGEQILTDDINYDLLGKDRSTCTSAELDKIRRERNRMHAKRTRDRKRIFMEEMELMIEQLEAENKKLNDHIDQLNGIHTSNWLESNLDTHSTEPLSKLSTVASNKLLCHETGLQSSNRSSKTVHSQLQVNDSQFSVKSGLEVAKLNAKTFQSPTSEHSITFDQINSLLMAASAFEKLKNCEPEESNTLATSVTNSTVHSANHSVCGDDDNDNSFHEKSSSKHYLQAFRPNACATPTSIETS